MMVQTGWLVVGRVRSAVFVQGGRGITNLELCFLCTWLPLDKIDLDKQSVTEKGENTVMSFILVSLRLPQTPYPLHSEVFCECGWWVA